MSSTWKPRIPLLLVGLFAVLGAVFAGTSAADYIAHLDRQMHAVTCSYFPGLGSPDASGTSGCFTVMMSPYAAVLRASTWGGLPIALPALAVFLFLLFKALDTLLRKREDDRHETFFLVLACLLPVVTSVIYWIVSVAVIGTVCKLCVGVYVASFGAFGAAIAAHLRAGRARRPRGVLEALITAPVLPAPAQAGYQGGPTALGGPSSPPSDPGVAAAIASLPPPPDEEAPPAAGLFPLPWGRYLAYFLEGVLFVGLCALLYLAFKPGYTEEMARCGKLLRPQDTYQTRLKLHPVPGGVRALEVLDPLCPACKGFHERLEASGLLGRLDLEAALFPLDKECNWMVTTSVHPGACAVSEALLCAGERAPEVLAWSFENHESIRERAKEDPASARASVVKAFPALAGCVGKPAVAARLNKALRWAVANSLPVLTPQLYVQDQKLCDEDTDLGLEFTLTRLLAARAQSGGKS
ncbi:MAG TPA: vitamin K epoxide reductase family protein [Myxococcota bacterium]|nr:vitamin K epoxide reductase family protein [Myxococcota bacterium]HRY96413.1 vitamin K epoxide reductase family protein [Myxococcota bacterium]HSA21765.1 vitamin K epoxide reductase family protein [Myxococcota bacterium]